MKDAKKDAKKVKVKLTKGDRLKLHYKKLKEVKPHLWAMDWKKDYRPLDVTDHFPRFSCTVCRKRTWKFHDHSGENTSPSRNQAMLEDYDPFEDEDQTSAEYADIENFVPPEAFEVEEDERLNAFTVDEFMPIPIPMTQWEIEGISEEEWEKKKK